MLTDLDIEQEERAIIEAAHKWHDVRREIFAKEKSNISDWNKLSDAEHGLMDAVKNTSCAKPETDVE